MLSSLLRFELGYHFRQLSFKIAALLFLVMGVMATHLHFSGNVIHINAPHVIAAVVCFLSLFSIFAVTLFCVNVILRDVSCRMEELLFSTAIQRSHYFITRFAGLVVAVFMLLCLALCGLCIGALFSDAAERGPNLLIYYCSPLLVFGIPNILFVCSLLMGTALLTRNTKAVYVTGVLLYILYLMASVLGNSPMLATSSRTESGSLVVPYLLDPFALAVFFGETRSWTDVQLNQQLFPLSSLFVLNRLLWMAVSLLVLGLCYRFFAFRLLRRTKVKAVSQEPVTTDGMDYHPLPFTVNNYRHTWAAFYSQLKLDTVALLKHIPFMVMLLLWMCLVGMDVWDTLHSGLFGIQTYPVSGIIAEQLRSMRPAIILLVLYAGELLHRERVANMQGLTYSSPVSYAVLLVAKCTALAVLVAALVGTTIITGITIQVLDGSFNIDLPVYLSLFYYSGVPLLLFALLIVFIQVLVTEKYLGMLLSLVAAGFIVFSRRMGVEHYLLRYATTPEFEYSSMNGFGHYAGTFNWYMLYWSGVALVLLVLAVTLWQRDIQASWWKRLRGIGMQWNAWRLALFTAALLVSCAAGMYIYQQTNKVGKYKSRGDMVEWQLKYELQYKPFAHLPQPVITAVNTAIDLYPDESRYNVKGIYQLRNNTRVNIDSILVGVHPEVTAVTISMPGIQRQVHDSLFNQHWLYLQQPLKPGDSSTLQFLMQVVRSGFTPFNREHVVVSNGSYIELEKYVPFLGYNNGLETSDEVARKAKGMALQQDTALAGDYSLVRYETTVSTAANQQVITVGSLQKTWASANRKYFHYVTPQPVPFMFALSSGEYAMKKEEYKGVALSIYYQQGEDANVPVMLQGMKDALDYCVAQFSPYPLKQLTLAAIPQYRGAATAYPGVVFSAERINFQSDFSDTNKVNYAYAITVHEVAHQWWANQLIPMDGPGRTLLTESMAKYTEAMLLERKFGKAYIRKYLRGEQNFYFFARGIPELPLIRTDGDPPVAYQKGCVALYMLKESFGEDSLNAAFRQLLKKYRDAPGVATAAVLLQILRQRANTQQLSLIDVLLNRVITYDARVKVLSCTPTTDGRYQLRLSVGLLKTEHLPTGERKALVPDDIIDIGLFDRLPGEWNNATRPLYLQKQRFTAAQNEIMIVVDKKPRAVVVDPYAYILDEDQGNNVSGI